MIIGITGTISSGKNTVYGFLVEHGFIHLSLSGIIRDIALKNGIGIERTALQNLGNALRERNGPGALAKEALEIAERNGWKKLVISGIRNPGEVLELRKQSNFVLIGVDAPQEERFQRIQKRQKDKDPANWEDFLKIDNRDLGIGENDMGQGVQKCLSMADFLIKNDSTFEEFEKRVREVYNEILEVSEIVEDKKVNSDVTYAEEEVVEDRKKDFKTILMEFCESNAEALRAQLEANERFLEEVANLED